MLEVINFACLYGIMHPLMYPPPLWGYGGDLTHTNVKYVHLDCRIPTIIPSYNTGI